MTNKDIKDKVLVVGVKDEQGIGLKVNEKVSLEELIRLKGALMDAIYAKRDEGEELPEEIKKFEQDILVDEVMRDKNSFVYAMKSVNEDSLWVFTKKKISRLVAINVCIDIIEELAKKIGLETKKFFTLLEKNLRLWNNEESLKIEESPKMRA